MKARIVLALAAAAAVLSSCASTPEPRSDDLLPAKKPGVAIFAFDVKSSDPADASMGGDVAQAITESLLKGGKLKPVERSELNKIMVEQEFSASGLVKEEDALKIGRLSGARYILLGSVSPVADQVRINARMLDVETAEIILAESVFGKKSAIFQLESQLAKKLEEGAK